MERTVSLASDPGSIAAGQRHVITITCDGHADLLSMVIDGRLQDGGETRERGTAWFDHAFAAPGGATRWKMGSAPAASVDRRIVHGRSCSPARPSPCIATSRRRQRLDRGRFRPIDRLHDPSASISGHGRGCARAPSGKRP